MIRPWLLMAWIAVLAGCTVVIWSENIAVDTEIDSPDINPPIKRVIPK